MDLADNTDDLAARQSEHGLQLVLVVIDDASAEPYVVHIDDFHHIACMETAFDPFNANGKEAVTSVDQRLLGTGIDYDPTQRRGHKAEPLLFHRQGRQVSGKIRTFAAVLQCFHQIAGLVGFTDEYGNAAAGGDFGGIDFRAHAAGSDAGAGPPAML